MVEIIPAILPKSFDELSEAMAQVSGLVKMVQVDVCDGVFVKNKTWPYFQKNDSDFAEILKENGGFPYWEEMDFEVDLMIKPTEEEIQKWITAGAKRLVIHVESVENPEAFVEKIRSSLPSPDSVFHTEVGIAINPDTPNDVLKHIVKHIDFIQCMGISNIGHQGEPFDESVLEKIHELRVLHPNVTISVDGAVNEETAPLLIDAGATRLVIGSAIFESGDIPGTIQFFQSLAAAEE
jgi:ribulose-phosphate 3-epimerase